MGRRRMDEDRGAQRAKDMESETREKMRTKLYTPKDSR
jgi:hypothetical protein